MVLEKVLKVFGFRPLIKASGKRSFDDLSRAEFSQMILSYLSGDSSIYDGDAIYEFMDMDLSSPVARLIREKVEEIYYNYREHSGQDGLSSCRGRAALTELATELQRSSCE